jgi:hypothetical protein
MYSDKNNRLSRAVAKELQIWFLEFLGQFDLPYAHQYWKVYANSD